MWYPFSIFQTLLIICHTFICILLALPPALIGFPKIAYAVGRNIWGPFLIFMVGARVVVKGKENLGESETYIFSANHMSNYDIPLLFAKIPVDLHFIAKKELKKIPFFGWCMSAMGMIFIDRSNRVKAIESLKKAGDLIKNGKNVITFPEGRRSRSGNIEMFRKGTFVIAKESQIDVIPVAVKGSNILHQPGTMKFRPGKVFINIGKPISAKDFKDKTPEEFANYTQKVVEELYNEL